VCIHYTKEIKKIPPLTNKLRGELAEWRVKTNFTSGVELVRILQLLIIIPRRVNQHNPNKSISLPSVGLTAIFGFCLIGELSFELIDF
jgi:hypothetical protein